MENNQNKEFISNIVGKISEGKAEDYSSEMPSFDLAQQILAKQRNIAALKRRSPGSENTSSSDSVPSQKSAVQIKPFTAMAEQPMSPQQKVIADIIAREIKALTAGR